MNTQAHHMVEEQIASRGILNPRILEAMKRIPRQLFVPQKEIFRAYSDRPLSIGQGQTISQPYIVALMTESLELHSQDRVLEIGTGCGYQTALLAEMGCEVFSVEILSPLLQKARRLLKDLGYRKIHFRLGDGSLGWNEEAPYNAILIAAAAKSPPPALLSQLALGGRMILPLGDYRSYQELSLYEKEEHQFHHTYITDVRFVPLVLPQ